VASTPHPVLKGLCWFASLEVERGYFWDSGNGDAIKHLWPVGAAQGGGGSFMQGACFLALLGALHLPSFE